MMIASGMLVLSVLFSEIIYHLQEKTQKRMNEERREL